MKITKFLNGLLPLTSGLKMSKYNFSLVLILIFSVPFFAFGQEKNPYSALFQKYPVAKYYNGPISKINLNSDPNAFQFRTRLESGIKQGPNYSGSFSVIEWGCGTNCTQIVIVDVETGTICDWAVTCGSSDYRLDSNLLVINPGTTEDGRNDYPGGCSTEFYTFKNYKLKKIGAVSK